MVGSCALVRYWLTCENLPQAYFASHLSKLSCRRGAVLDAVMICLRSRAGDRVELDAISSGGSVFIARSGSGRTSSPNRRNRTSRWRSPMTKSRDPGDCNDGTGFVAPARLLCEL